MVTFKSKIRKPQGWYSNRVNTIPPPILFKRSLWNKDAEDAESTAFKLRSNPTDKDSQLYELRVRSFANGTPEQFILWKRDLDKVIKGQNVTRPTDKYEMARRVLYGDALAVFDKEALTLVQEDEESFQKCLKALANHVFPKNALSSQKAWLRHSDDVKKKPNMPTRTWTARLQEINQMLSEFPPTFSKIQRISDEDFVEVIEYGIPYSWRAKMAEQGFVPVNHTLTEIVEFCNKMEYAEEMTGINNSQNNQNNRKTGQHAEADSESGDTYTGAILHAKAPQGVRKKRRERHTSFLESNGSNGCALHQKVTDHTTGECRVLLGQAKKMRAAWDAQPRDKNFQRQKTYNNDKLGGNQNKKYNGDFHTLLGKIEQVKESVDKALQQQRTINGKRKIRDETQEEYEEEETNGNFNSKDNFVCELDQLSLSEDDQKSE
jgi:hypothetical protein